MKSFIRLELDMPNVDGLGEQSMEELRPSLLAFAEEAAVSLKDKIKASLGGRGRGALDQGGHAASLPGEAPAQRTGDYASSYEHDSRMLKREVQGRVGSRLWRLFGATLEYGNARIRPRPHVGKAFFEWKREVIRKLSEQERG